MCRQVSGSFNIPFAAFARKYVHFDGAEQLKRYRSSEGVERLLCGGCGSQIGMDYTAEPDTVALTLGSESNQI